MNITQSLQVTESMSVRKEGIFFSQLVGWLTTMLGPAIVMVRIVCLSICLSHTHVSEFK